MAFNKAKIHIMKIQFKLLRYFKNCDTVTTSPLLSHFKLIFQTFIFLYETFDTDRGHQN